MSVEDSSDKLKSSNHAKLDQSKSSDSYGLKDPKNAPPDNQSNVEAENLDQIWKAILAHKNDGKFMSEILRLIQ